jgi:23S rRNA pseudouridine1911/1915/1917 synthase
MKITEENVRLRLDMYVSTVLGVTRSNAQILIDEGNVTVNGKEESKSYKLRLGDEVEITEAEPKELDVEPENIPLNIVYEDNDIIVINKPSGMVVHPANGNETGTLVNALLYHCGSSLSGINGVVRPGIVHRIDKDTSGLLVVAKNDESHVYLSSLLKDHGIKRTYYAIIIGHMREQRGTIDAPIARHPVDRKKMAVVAGGKEAITHYEVIKEFNGYSLLKLNLETGRTHQIRVHLSYKGHPIIGDTVYGGGKTQFEKANKSLLDGQALHARELSFPHPRTKEIMHLECDFPDNFKMLIERLEKI